MGAQHFDGYISLDAYISSRQSVITTAANIKVLMVTTQQSAGEYLLAEHY